MNVIKYKKIKHQNVQGEPIENVQEDLIENVQGEPIENVQGEPIENVLVQKMKKNTKKYKNII